MHQIRLSRAWSGNLVADAAEEPRLRYERRFHRPSGLSPEQTVELLLDRKSSAVVLNFSVRLNGQPLSHRSAETSSTSQDSGSFACQIQQQLQPFNTLHVEFAWQAQAECNDAKLLPQDSSSSGGHEEKPPRFEDLFDARLVILGD